MKFTLNEYVFGIDIAETSLRFHDQAMTLEIRGARESVAAAPRGESRGHSPVPHPPRFHARELPVLREADGSFDHELTVADHKNYGVTHFLGEHVSALSGRIRWQQGRLHVTGTLLAGLASEPVAVSIEVPLPRSGGAVFQGLIDEQLPKARQMMPSCEDDGVLLVQALAMVVDARRPFDPEFFTLQPGRWPSDGELRVAIDYLASPLGRPKLRRWAERPASPFNQATLDLLAWLLAHRKA